MAYCRYCGKQINNDSLFCTSCGSKLDETEINGNSNSADIASNRQVQSTNFTVGSAALVIILLIIIAVIWTRSSVNDNNGKSTSVREASDSRGSALSHSGKSTSVREASAPTYGSKIAIASVDCEGCSITDAKFSTFGESIIEYSLAIENTKSKTDEFGLIFTFYDNSGNPLGKHVVSQRLVSGQQLTLSNNISIPSSVSSSNVKSVSISAH